MSESASLLELLPLALQLVLVQHRLEQRIVLTKERLDLDLLLQWLYHFGILS
jgi:hypothetical protein